MDAAVKILRLLQLAMLSSVVIYAVIGEVAGPHRKPVNSSLSYLFTTLAVAAVGMIFVVRRTMVQRSAESLASSPADKVALNHWKTGFIVTYALCEALALLGLVLRMIGYNLQESLPYYAGGFILLFFFSPRLQARTSDLPGVST